MKQTWVDVADEAAGRVVLHSSVAPTVLGAGEDAMLLGTGDGNVE